MKENLKKENSNKNDFNDEETDQSIINDLKARKSMLEYDIENDEKSYKQEINSQNYIINELRKQNNVLEVKIKGLEQSKRIKQIEKREKKRRLNNINYNYNENNNNFNRKKVYSRDSNNQRIYSNYNNNNNNKNFRNFPSFKNKIKDDDILTRTPNFKVKADKISKPFEINKFNMNNKDIANHTGYNQKHSLTPNEPPFNNKNPINSANSRLINYNQNNFNNNNNNKHFNNKIKIEDPENNFIAQIENLKKSIQLALKNNAVEFNVDNNNLINANNVQHNNNDNIATQANKIMDYEQSEIMNLNNNNDMSEFKQAFDALNELEGNISKISPYKRKECC